MIVNQNHEIEKNVIKLNIKNIENKQYNMKMELKIFQIMGISLRKMIKLSIIKFKNQNNFILSGDFF